MNIFFYNLKDILLGLFLIFPSIGWMSPEPSYRTKLKFFRSNNGNALNSIKQEDLRRFHHLVVEFPVQSRKFILDLYRRRYILDHIEPIFSFDNKNLMKYLKCDDIKPIQYTGKIRDMDDSSVKLTFCGRIMGQIEYTNEILFVVTAPFHENANFIDLDNELFVYRGADCTLNSLDFLSRSEPILDAENSFLHRRKRDGSYELKAYEENPQSVFIEVGLVVDNELYNSYDRNRSRIYEVCKNVINKVNELFQNNFAGKIFVAWVYMEIWENETRINVTENSFSTYENFEPYARELIQNYSIDYVQLITKISFKEQIVARFSTQKLCKYESTWCGVIHYDLKSYVKLSEHLFLSLAQSIACSNRMIPCNNSERDLKRLNPEKDVKSEIKKINHLLKNINGTCLKNKPSKLYGKPVCGNRFQEQNEECDCGVPGNGHCNGMCDADSCKIKIPSCTSRGCDDQGDPKSLCNINTWNTIPKQIQQKEYKYDSGHSINSTRIPRFLELALVIGKSIFLNLDKNITKINNRYKKIVNQVNWYFQKFDIFIALVNVEIWSCVDNVTNQSNWTTTFENFGKYVKNMADENVDHVQLITVMNFEKEDISYVLENTICSNLTYGVIMDKSDTTLIVTTIHLTQALALSMGIKWDNDINNCSCNAEKCIMSRSRIGKDNQNFGWSSCSNEMIKKKLANRQIVQCLKAKPKRLFDSPNCGNGFTEQGEDCDCGWEDGCKNPCCDASTCKYIGRALCATGECCDTASCNYTNPGTVCRSSLHDCDLPEYCDGRSEYCPDDVLKNPGTHCDSEGPECDSHQCIGKAANCKKSACGHGICNSKGNCHCDDGFAPPTCKDTGTGGSIDSGPAQNQKPDIRNDATVVNDTGNGGSIDSGFAQNQKPDIRNDATVVNDTGNGGSIDSGFAQNQKPNIRIDATAVYLLLVIILVILLLVIIFFIIRKCSKFCKQNKSPAASSVCADNETSTKPMSLTLRPLPPKPNTVPSINHSVGNYYYESIGPEYAMITAISESASNWDNLTTLNSSNKIPYLKLNSIYSSCSPKHSLQQIDPSNVNNNELLCDADERKDNLTAFKNYDRLVDRKRLYSTYSAIYLRPIRVKSNAQLKIGNSFPRIQVPENMAPDETSFCHEKFISTTPPFNTQTEFSDENASSSQVNGMEVTSQVHINDSSWLSFFGKLFWFSKN